MSERWKPKQCEHVKTKFGNGIVIDTYWAQRDRYTVLFPNGESYDFGSASLLSLERPAPNDTGSD